MGGRTLHLHDARIGIGLPSRTVRPFRRRGDALLGAFLAALGTEADRVVLTGRLFDRADPPAHVVDRVVGPLADLVERGVAVAVPALTPRALLFLAAGISLGGNDPPAGGNGLTPEEFWRAGAFRLLRDGAVETRRVQVPGQAEVRVSVTGLDARTALDRIHAALDRRDGVRLLRLTLTGSSAEPEILSFGPRELGHHLSGGAEGTVTNRVSGVRGVREIEDEDRRRAELGRIRESLPELPETTGIYEFRDGRGRALYVGKAVNIRRRVASHFTSEARERSPRGPMLLAARSIRTWEKPSEVEALLAEADRIREVRPPYNRQMREPEGARYLRADPDGPAPSLTSATVVKEDGATWYGPFPKRWAVERALRVLQVVHGLKSCDWKPGEPAPAACTDRDLGICAAPCTGRTSLVDHRRRTRAAVDHLLGRDAGAPPFGALNSPGAGLLGTEDLRIFDGLARSARRLLGNLSASGGLRLPGGRVLLVLGGLRAGERSIEGAPADAWIDRRVAEFAETPPRTWIPEDRAHEVRILANRLRES